ncbi:hypothetical protein QL093DRAFT_2082855 [Fusarium oxysporum]|nr:hypothetical protein QL093DRAFT_2082855 [Fusarium oxysporum]
MFGLSIAFSASLRTLPGIASSDPPYFTQILTLAVSLVRNVSPPPRLTKANPLATTLTRLSRTPRLPLFHPRALVVQDHDQPWSSSRLSLLQYPLGLPSDGLEPLVVQAAEGCFDKRVAVVERVYEQEYLATKGCQPDAASIIPMQPGLSDFHRHITKLVVTVFLDSLVDHINHIVAFSVAIRRGSRIGLLTEVEAQWMIQAWYGSAKEWPLKWVAGRRLGPAEEQVRLSSWVMCS